MARILIVEDDLTFSLMLSTWLGKKGFDVTSAANVKDAKQHLSDKDFELIISDLRLPDSDGIDLLQWVKSPESSVARNHDDKLCRYSNGSQGNEVGGFRLYIQTGSAGFIARKNT